MTPWAEARGRPSGPLPRARRPATRGVERAPGACAGCLRMDRRDEEVKGAACVYRSGVVYHHLVPFIEGGEGPEPVWALGAGRPMDVRGGIRGGR